MLQFIFSQYLQQPGKGDGQNACDWMMLSRVWFPQSSCQVSQQSRFTDFSQTIKSNGSPYQINGTNNLSLINVFTIPDFIPNWCQFSILQIAENATLSNAIFNINATLDLTNASTYCNTNNITVAVFDQVFGSLVNVTVFGNINIVNFNFPNATLLLSQLIGNVGPQFNGSKQLINVASNLTYTYFPNDGTANKTINTTTTVSQNQTINLTTSSFNAVIPPINKTVNISAYSYNEEIYDALFNTISNYTVLSLFPNVDNYTSVFTNLYQVSLEGFLEKTNITQNLDVKYYNSSGDEIVFPDDSIPNYDLTVYYSNYIAYGFLSNNFSFQCASGQLIGIQDKKCILNTECQGYIFEALCLKSCPLGYVLINVSNICYYSCPQELGYAVQMDNTCAQCSGNSSIASFQGCTNTIQTNQTQYIYSTQSTAIFQNCPPGMIQSESNATCSYPGTERDCTTNGYSYLVNVTNSYQTTFVLNKLYCTNEQEAGLFLLHGTATLVNFCNGNISLRQECFENVTQPCINNAITQASQWNENQKQCQISCNFGYVYNEDKALCLSTCPEQFYSFSEFGNCVPCLSDQYDGGTVWNRQFDNCTIKKNCIGKYLINETQKGLICEQYNDSTNCNNSISYSTSNKICINVNCVGQMWDRQTDSCVNDSSCTFHNGSICESTSSTVLSKYCPFSCIIETYNVCNTSAFVPRFLSSTGQCKLDCLQPSIGFYLENQSYCISQCPSNLQNISNNCQIDIQQQSENMYIGLSAAAGVAIIATVIIVSMACCKKKEGLKVKAKLNTNSAVNYYAKQTETATLKIQRENRSQMLNKPQFNTSKQVNQGQENNQCQPQTQPKVPQVQEIVEENSEDEKKKNFQVPSPPLLGAQPVENKLQQNLKKAAANANLKSRITGPQLQNVGIKKVGIQKPGLSKANTKRADIVGQSGMGQEQGIVVQRMRKVEKEK